VRLTASQWTDLKRDERERAAADAKMVSGAVVRLRGCLCRSVWCKRCAAISPTGAAIRERLSVFDWRKTRHCVLTVNREIPPSGRFDMIRSKRGIAVAMRSLGVARWVWVLEFHKGGWPHWHVIAETGGRMIGHDKLAGAWGHGLVWESPIKSESHWKATLGYHAGKGYFAGESKGHQLELPAYLKGSSRVRKFGANFSCGGGHGDSKQNPCQKHKTKRRRPARSYAEREGTCDKEAQLVVGDRVMQLDGSLRENRDALEKVSMASLGWGRYFLGQEELSRVLRNQAEGGPSSPTASIIS